MQESIEIVRYKHQYQVSKYQYNIWLMKLEVESLRRGGHFIFNNTPWMSDYCLNFHK